MLLKCLQMWFRLISANILTIYLIDMYIKYIVKVTYTVKFGHAVAQLVETQRYKPEGRGFDSRCCHWNFVIDVTLSAALQP